MKEQLLFRKFITSPQHALKTIKHTLAAAALGLCAWQSTPVLAVEIDSDRSLFIRDIAILERFSLNETLQRLLDDSGDVANTPQSLLDTLGSDCDPTMPISAFGSSCGRISRLGDVNDFQAIALTNRFDLASSTGEHCGEYRLALFNQQSGDSFNNVDFVIFESRLPNPNPQLGLEGCRPVTNFWADLSNIDDINTRADQLHDFYFNGLPNFTPVVDVNNYRGSENGSGQIRFNRRTSARTASWLFLELRTHFSPGNFELLHSTVKDVPSATLLTGTAPSDLIQAFEAAVIEGLDTPGEKLLSSSMGTLNYNLPNSLNVGSTGFSSTSINSGATFFSDNFDAQSNLAGAIHKQLNAVGSNLTPTQVIARVNALTCAGCHNQASDLGGPLEFVSTGQQLEMLSIGREAGEEILVEAENFDQMSGVQTEPTQDANGGLNVGWLDAGDWMVFNTPLPVSTDGRYKFTYRVSGLVQGSLRLEQPGGGQTWATQTIDATDGWQSWRDIEQFVEIPAGEQGFAIVVQEAGWNINWIKVEALSGDRMIIKDALKNEFIPERKTIFENFLNSACSAPSCLDSDNDGVTDNLDHCPNTVTDANVDVNGCELPTGGHCDGVTAYPNWLHNDFDGGPNTHLNTGERMQHNGQLFEANWYSDTLPGTNVSWVLIGDC